MITIIHNEFSWPSKEGIKMYAQEWVPEGPAKAVIALVHGLGEHSGRYAHVGQRFGQDGYILQGFDLRGHGKSGGLRGHSPSFDAIMEDIDRHLASVKERHPGLPVFLYGHSLGGLLVLNYSLKRKPALQGVICTSPGLATAKPVSPITLSLGKIMYNLMPEFSLDNGLDLAGLSRDPAVVAAYKEPLTHGKISARMGLDFLNAGQWVLTQAGNFPLPLLLMQGSADRLVNPEATRQFASGLKGDATFKMWEGFYHELHNEPEKEEVFQFMLAWLKRHLP